MKILLLNLLMNVATQATETSGTEDYSWMLKELNSNETTELTALSRIQNKVMIYDAAGNLVKEILKNNYEDNNMTQAEYKLLANSSQMFEYLGDVYFLLVE